MADIANLVLSVDSSQVPRATAALDGLTAAGARAEAATAGLTGGIRGAGVEATAMAAAAQASARAVMGQAAGFGAATEAARINTLAMRETLVVARELSRGNFTRLPGSLTLLAQGIGSQGGVSAFASAITQQLGLVKTLQNAELAEQAVAAASAAAAVENAARRAAANVMAADTELALAEAQLRVTQGTSAEAAAQVRLAAAHDGVAAAAAEAAIAENALAVAMGRSAEAGAASAAESVTTVSALGATLGITAIAAGLLFAAFDEVKQSADDLDPSAKRFIATLGLTQQEINRLKDTAVTWGDVAKGTFDAVAEAAGSSASQFESFWHDAFLQTAQVGVSAAQVIMGAFAGMVQGVHSAVEDAWHIGTNLASAWHGGGAINTTQLKNPAQDALDQFNKTFSNVGKFFHETAPNAVNRRRDMRLQDQANKLIDRRIPKKGKKGRKGPKEAVDHADDMSARLDEQILSAKLKLAGTAQEQAALQIQQVEIEKNKTIADAQSLQKQGKITSGEEQHIEEQAKQLADLKKQAILRDEQTKLLTQQQAAQDQIFGFQADALKFADQMATTQADHRKAQLEMLDILYEQKKYDLEILESKQKLAGDLAAAALTQNQINHLPVEKAMQQQVTMRNTMDPLHQWLDQVPHTAAQITEAIQGIEVNGIDRLASGITDVITGTKSLGAAFKDIANSIIQEIIQMTVKMLIFRAISSIFGGGISSPGLGGASFSGGFDPAAAAAPLAHMANGGSMIIGGNGGVDNNVLSLNGKPIAMVGQGETLAVYPNRPQAANDKPHLVVVQVATDENFTASVQSTAAQTVIAAAPHIAQAGAETAIRTMNRPRLMNG